MSKVTKKELARKVKELERFVDYADNLLTQLNHALPEPLEIKHWRDEQADHDEVIAILDSKEPKLKQLDQSVFDGLDEKWRFAAVGKNGSGYKFRFTPKVSGDSYLCDEGYHKCSLVGEGYDATNWKKSLIKRESKELTGSDLCRYIKSRKHWVLAVVSDENDATAEFHQRAVVVTGIASDGDFVCGDTVWRYAVPIDHKGEPLTASEVGL